MPEPRRPKVLLIGTMYHPDGEALLAEHTDVQVLEDPTEDEIQAAIADADAAIVRYPPACAPSRSAPGATPDRQHVRARHRLDRPQRGDRAGRGRRQQPRPRQSPRLRTHPRPDPQSGQATHPRRRARAPGDPRRLGRPPPLQSHRTRRAHPRRDRLRQHRSRGRAQVRRRLQYARARLRSLLSAADAEPLGATLSPTCRPPARGRCRHLPPRTERRVARHDRRGRTCAR